ncbi:uncharacterized protein [Symphalangus syndactylus]|uniref:uncharacterized protein n=1 Tax=Symphalangus syndactylus TaxID=9590 RepID=UPI003005BADF
MAGGPGPAVRWLSGCVLNGTAWAAQAESNRWQGDQDPQHGGLLADLFRNPESRSGERLHRKEGRHSFLSIPRISEPAQVLRDRPSTAHARVRRQPARVWDQSRQGSPPSPRRPPPAFFGGVGGDLHPGKHRPGQRPGLLSFQRLNSTTSQLHPHLPTRAPPSSSASRGAPETDVFCPMLFNFLGLDFPFNDHSSRLQRKSKPFAWLTRDWRTWLLVLLLPLRTWGHL